MKKELKILRIKHDVTKEVVAEKLGVEKTTYCRKEKGKIAFSLQDVKILKEFYNLTPEEVVQIFLT